MERTNFLKVLPILIMAVFVVVLFSTTNLVAAMSNEDPLDEDMLDFSLEIDSAYAAEQEAYYEEDLEENNYELIMEAESEDAPGAATITNPSVSGTAYYINNTYWYYFSANGATKFQTIVKIITGTPDPNNTNEPGEVLFDTVVTTTSKNILFRASIPMRVAGQNCT